MCYLTGFFFGHRNTNYRNKTQTRRKDCCIMLEKNYEVRKCRIFVNIMNQFLLMDTRRGLLEGEFFKISINKMQGHTALLDTIRNKLYIATETSNQYTQDVSASVVSNSDCKTDRGKSLKYSLW